MLAAAGGTPLCVRTWGDPALVECEDAGRSHSRVFRSEGLLTRGLQKVKTLGPLAVTWSAVRRSRKVLHSESAVLEHLGSRRVHEYRDDLPLLRGVVLKIGY